jgi:hypothetical protein
MADAHYDRSRLTLVPGIAIVLTAVSLNTARP